MLKPGMFISDRYEIIDKVGSGGMADVYKARCHRLNRFVAIKVLKTEYSDDKNFVKKFRGEAQSAAGLSHPNIVNVYDVGDDNGLHYIVMELVEGITLKNFIERKGKLEVKEAVGIAIQIAMGMEAAHTNHIIHRDIKPQNIIISREGKVKVTDFGIAKATNSNTITSNAMGSVHYLSPEQARGGYSDEKSDIYSLGVTLYEMLSGQVPFAGDNTVSVALLHIQGEATPLREIDPSIPLSVDRIVQKCMQKKPERRYLSASELMADLKKSISNPNGDFVVIPAAAVNDSPTITISPDEVNHIKNATKNTNGYNTSNDIYNTDGRRNLNNTKQLTDEEEDLDTVDPRVEKLLLIGSITAGVIITILILFFVAKFFKLFPNNGNTNHTTPTVTVTPTPSTVLDETAETITIPSVVGLMWEDAQETLLAKSDKLNVTIAREEYSDTFEKGMVIEQYPTQGAEVEGDSDVELVISSGPESFEVPNVYNLTDSQAVTKLEEAGLVVAHDFAFSDEIEKDRVISTNPERGMQVVKGDTITVLVSSGPEKTDVIVPDLLGLTKKQAIKKLEDVGLKQGNITSDYSDTYGKDEVMYQSYSGGATVAAGTAVDITISLGTSVIDEPSDEPSSQTYVSQIVISDNPFEYQGDSAKVIVELEQDGRLTTLRKETMDYDSFPLSISNITSESGSDGTIQMYIGREVEEYEDGVVTEDGVLIKYEPYETSWVIEFTPVEE
jgi:eukaryotic-like serine/threonine-protein kinase